MSIELQQVRRRIASTRQIRKVTGAMQRVASARLVNDRRVMLASRLYTERLERVIDSVCRECVDPEHALLRPQRGPSVALAVFGSERGLCGGFNSALMDELDRFMNRFGPEHVTLIAVGKIIQRRARRHGLRVANAFSQPTRQTAEGASAHEKLIGDIAAIVTNLYAGGACREVHVLYSRFTSGLVQNPVVERVLPIARSFVTRSAAPAVQAALPGSVTFDPSAADVLSALLPEYIEQALDRAFLNSLASENASRQVAMSRASENAGEMLNGLMMTYSRLRQENITREMIELSAGSVA